MYCTGNHTQYLIITNKGKESKKSISITESLSYTLEANTTL